MDAFGLGLSQIQCPWFQERLQISLVKGHEPSILGAKATTAKDVATEGGEAKTTVDVTFFFFHGKIAECERVRDLSDIAGKAQPWRGATFYSKECIVSKTGIPRGADSGESEEVYNGQVR
ncbi:hypothetical protein IEQ34_005264 [Dendrobium chrysotoxum]|uniref:Uncharacterized protein n=1 Tax=Dendrobium chrysotoxum TaxID=161865 RepID=A0AAV7H8D4_DENCH|nr:hypothetical protein IEQ34_005264 [Dendrobium chrysotoxum]